MLVQISFNPGQNALLWRAMAGVSEPPRFVATPKSSHLSASFKGPARLKHLMNLFPDILWMDEIRSHHLRSHGMMIPLEIPTNNGFKHGFHLVRNGFGPSTVLTGLMLLFETSWISDSKRVPGRPGPSGLPGHMAPHRPLPPSAGRPR